MHYLTFANGEALVIGVGEIDAEAETLTLPCSVAGKRGLLRLSDESPGKKAKEEIKRSERLHDYK